MNKPMTKQEWLSYIEKTWDTAQREAWGETPRKGAGMTDKTELSIKTIFLIIAIGLLIFWHAVAFLIYWGLT